MPSPVTPFRSSPAAAQQVYMGSGREQWPRGEYKRNHAKGDPSGNPRRTAVSHFQTEWERTHCWFDARLTGTNGHCDRSGHSMRRAWTQSCAAW